MLQPCVPNMPGPLSKNFGTISDYAPSRPPMVPEIVLACVKEIERRGFKEVGIYRVSCTEKQALELRVIIKQFNQGLNNCSMKTT